MSRPLFRSLLLAGCLLAVPAPAPASAQTPPLEVLHVVPQADVAVTDPLFTTAWISTIHGTMVWESLFAWNSRLASLSPGALFRLTRRSMPM